MADELSILMRLRGARRVNQELEGTARSVDKIDRAAKKNTATLGAFSKSMSRTGTVLTRRLSLPVAAAGGIATKMAFDYEESMTRVRTLTAASGQQVDRWSDEILDLAKETGRAPDDLARGLFFVASSGLELNKVMGAMPAIAKGAAIGLGDTETIAQLVTSAMNAYANSNLTAAQTMDTLIAGTGAGKLEATDLAASLGRVLPIASRLGVPLKGVVGAMEAMSMTGTDAETAATQTSAFFSQLIRKTPKGEKALKKVGLTYEGLVKQLGDKGILDVVKTIDKAFKGDLFAMGEVFANIRALRTMLGLTGDQAKNVERVFKETTNSAGATKEAWAELSESDSFKLRKGIVAIQVAMIRLGEMVAPTVTRIAGGVEKLANLLSGHGKAGLSLMAALILLGPVMKTAAFGLQILRARMMMAAGASLAGTAGVTGLSAALLASPITWIVIGLAAIAIGFYLLYTRVEGFRNAVQAVWSWIKGHWRLLLALGLGPVGVAIIIVVNKFKTLKRWLAIVWDWAKKVGNKLRALAGPFDKVKGAASWVGGKAGGAANAANRFLGGKAMGGPIAQSGRYLVGEGGPEIVNLRAGESVTPNHALGGELVTAPIIVKLGPRVIAESTARVVADRKARK